MVSYNLPKLKLPKRKSSKKPSNFFKKSPLELLFLIVLVSSLSGFLAGMIYVNYFYQKPDIGSAEYDESGQEIYSPQTAQEEAITLAVKEVSPAVVSIIVSKDVPVMEQYYEESPLDGFFFGDPFFNFAIPRYRQKGTESRQIGGGTGFIVSEDGMIVTNKHVVLDEEADYTVLTLDGEEFSAEVLARDPVQDIAVLKIESEEEKFFPYVKLGDSDKIQIGQTAIAIGYVLGKYQNTVLVGVISGLGRTITASGGDFYETIEDVIQTDAGINKGNSGGPLLNLKGEVIGINTAIDVEGQNIGFAIPIDKAKRDIEQVKSSGRISYPFLGIRYVLVDEDVQEENDLAVDYGAWIVGDEDNPAIISDSAAEKAGLKEGDIVLEMDGERIIPSNSLAKMIVDYSPGDEISLKVLVSGEEKIVNVVLGEMGD